MEIEPLFNSHLPVLAILTPFPSKHHLLLLLSSPMTHFADHCLLTRFVYLGFCSLACMQESGGVFKREKERVRGGGREIKRERERKRV